MIERSLLGVYIKLPMGEVLKFRNSLNNSIMAQVTQDPTLLNQIDAGASGRKRGHSYESIIALKLNSLSMPFNKTHLTEKYIERGKTECILLNKILNYLKWESCSSIVAYSTGRLATAEDGEKEVRIDNISIKESKSDIIIKLVNEDGITRIVGVSVKQCNNNTPTNAQVYFSTATAFYNTVVASGYPLSNNALIAMKQFCGDSGYRPLDDGDCSNRISTPERYFWEEINVEGRAEWEDLFTNHQDDITRLLLQKGYKDDPFSPEVILHKTKKAPVDNEEIAIFSMDEFISLSHKYNPFVLSKYRVKKGSHKEPEGVEHLAPRFGVVQMQRGGQKQHPTQLQFNLKAGYFYHPPFTDETL